jgi:tetratricopeptide (TPR) repeat protein
MEPTPALVEDYVPRAEEKKILRQVELVRQDRTSRALLLYGAGGVGKTKLVRALAEDSPLGADVRWVQPMDVDDSNFWLLENMQRRIAEELDPDGDYFHSFLTYLKNLPKVVMDRVGRDTVASHHSRMREVFTDCYEQFVIKTQATVVVTLDTVETMRSMYLLTSLTQMIRELPRTLFILAGRPTDGWDGKDTISEYLNDPAEGINTTELRLAGFEHADAMAFLEASAVSDAFEERPELKTQLVGLTEAHPLWLALSVDYLCRSAPPPELTLDPRSKLVRDAFRSRLIAPYQSVEYWPEAIKRLAVLRRSVDQEAWQLLMDDRGLPPGVDNWKEAWRQLCSWPWIRPRANNQYVTLHDAFAEELAGRLIPLHDSDEAWRQRMWVKAAKDYEQLIGDEPERVRRELVEIFTSAKSDEATLQQIDDLDVTRRELDQRLVAHLHYLLLSDFEKGTELFDKQFSDATARDDLQFLELVCHELAPFLPPGEQHRPQRDAVGVVVDRFRGWLTARPRRYVQIGLSVARFLIYNSQPEPALNLLNRLPEHHNDVGVELRYSLSNERGNALMRVPNKVEDAASHFEKAQRRAAGLASPERERRLAQACKELGFYFRNIGKWTEADEQYSNALDHIGEIPEADFSAAHREELASIQTNWAYLKALQGSYAEAISLVTQATEARRALGRDHGIAVSLSVAGEVQRYDRRFQDAWDLYLQAGAIFERLNNWSWLGLVLQEQAICLCQAHDAGEDLLPEPVAEAKVLITRAVDICRDHAARWYPSALNRAGRILGRDDPDRGLECLAQAIDEAQRIADGWFRSASLIEYLELCYRTWCDLRDRHYRARIEERAAAARELLERYRFKNFVGRWEILQGHIAMRDFLNSDLFGEPDGALEHYSVGFLELAGKNVGSYGFEAVYTEFAELRRLYVQLRPEVRSAWYDRLQHDWSNGPEVLKIQLVGLRGAGE